MAGILPADVRKLEGAQMNSVECIENAYLVIEDGVITEFGQSQGGSTVLNATATSDILTKLRDDAVFDHQICILDAFHMIHLSTLKLLYISRQYSRQCTYIVDNSFHNISALKCLIFSVLNVYACCKWQQAYMVMCLMLSCLSAESILADELDRSLDERVHVAVVVDERYEFAVAGEDLLNRP